MRSGNVIYEVTTDEDEDDEDEGLHPEWSLKQWDIVSFDSLIFPSEALFRSLEVSLTPLTICSHGVLRLCYSRIPGRFDRSCWPISCALLV